MRLDPHGDTSSFPKRSALPHIAGTPEGSAWFWGGNDELGRLNLLTPERIQKATQESVKTGQVVSLNLPLDVPGPPFFGRRKFSHEIRSIGQGAFDDHCTLNTQSSSQWDGFRHFADPKSGFFYNGVVSREILGGDENDNDNDNDVEDELRVTRKLGIDAWARHGIVGRGVLLDVYGWAKDRKTSYDPFSAHNITVANLQACAKAQDLAFQTGDILLVRTGWIEKYNSLTDDEREERSKLDLLQHKYAGLEASEEMKDFLHDTYFAAAASDNANFEAWPPPSFEGSLHASMLPLWGMPIGELWDLETLSVKCKETGRWNFLVTSAPGNVPGGVASPPNALAMF